MSSNPHRILITSGPTYEPIDAVRFIGNRSSGRLGSALADESARRGWKTTLLLGPAARQPSDSSVTIRRFQTTSDLEALLAEELPGHDVLIQAAAVADFRPKLEPGALEKKHRRKAEGLTLHLEPTPDLFAQCTSRRRPDQLMVGFALEPEADLMASAHAKMARKGADLVVANPLETMDSDMIRATVIGAPGTGLEAGVATEGRLTKAEFAVWLLNIIAEQLHARS